MEIKRARNCTRRGRVKNIGRGDTGELGVEMVGSLEFGSEEE